MFGLFHLIKKYGTWITCGDYWGRIKGFLRMIPKVRKHGIRYLYDKTYRNRAGKKWWFKSYSQSTPYPRTMPSG